MEGEWREVRKIGVGPSRSERNPVRQEINPNLRNPKPFQRRVAPGNRPARNWNHSDAADRNEQFHGYRNGETTFFFNNIPEDCSVDFLKWKFGSVKKPIDIFCPRKRDIKGKPFGFVRFENVVQEEELLADLNNLWIGSFKVRVFKPRFERAREELGRRDQEKQDTNHRAAEVSNLVPGSKRKTGVSFAEALSGKKSELPLIDEIFQFQSMDSEKEWLMKAYTGYIKNEFLWEDIKEEINSECSGMLKVTSMGGNLVLIQSTSDKQVEEILVELGEWSTFWFQWSRPWRYVDVNHQRIVWTRWIGVPLQAWNPRFFDLVCAKLGLVLKIDEGTRRRERLDEAFI